MGLQMQQLKLGVCNLLRLGCTSNNDVATATVATRCLQLADSDVVQLRMCHLLRRPCSISSIGIQYLYHLTGERGLGRE
eukprot:scaffold7815_cov68-Skeletonema_dohrnii-CCMP3373.AAC.1